MSDIHNSEDNNRRRKVQNFVVHIDDDSDNRNVEKKSENFSNRPENKGEIYFANYQKNKHSANGGSGDIHFTKNNAAPAPNSQHRVVKNTVHYGLNDFDEKLALEERKKREEFRKQQQANKGVNYTKRFFMSLIAIILCTCILSGIGIGCVNDVLAINGNEEEVEVEIPADATTKDVIKILKKHKLINGVTFCNLIAEFRGFNDGSYLGGRYYLSTSMGLEGMLTAVQQSQQPDDESIKLAFPEGWTIQQIADRLYDNEVIKNKENFLSAIQYDYGYSFMDNDSKNTYFLLEGYLYPDTYDFYMGESPASVIRRFLNNFQEKWTNDFDKRAKELGYSVTEILTIASIIQKEAANSEQMPGISSVIHNRLKRSVDYPLLQCDSTVNYVTNYLSAAIGESDAMKYKEYYDTNATRGLPAGPICSPGMAAITAALYPEDTKYLYFCHDETGKVYYATTDSEHSRNVAETIKVNSANK